MKKRQLVIIVSLAGLLASSFFLMRYLIAQKSEFARQQPPVSDRYVETQTVDYSTVHAPVEAKGRVVASAEIDVVAEAPGKIEPGDVSLKKGQSFKKGDVLLTVYKDETELALQAQKSRFLNTIANFLPDIKVDFPDRYDEFRAFFNDIDLNEDLPSLPPVDKEKFKIFLASRNVLNDYYSIKKTEKQLKRHTIYAPFNGSYVDVMLQVGSYTNAGGRIARIIHTDEVEVEVPVNNGDAKWIGIGDPVTLVSTAGNNNTSWKGSVARISSFVDVNTQSRPIFIRVPLNNQPQLYAGQYLIATFDGGQIQNAMSIPRNAVFNYNEVFVVLDSRLKKRQIDLLKTNETTVIFNGLEPGLEVVTQPLINASENTPVKILGKDSPKASQPSELQKEES